VVELQIVILALRTWRVYEPSQDVANKHLLLVDSPYPVVVLLRGLHRRVTTP